MTRFQALADQLAVELGRRELILDGEIVALDDDGRINFWDLMRGRGTLAYAAFDLLWLNGRDLRPIPLGLRKKRLEKLIPEVSGASNRFPALKQTAPNSSKPLASWISRVLWQSEGRFLRRGDALVQDQESCLYAKRGTTRVVRASRACSKALSSGGCRG